jgi:cobalt-zinc-cadmium efflux system protein
MIEITGGIISGSLALISDSVHMLIDFFSLLFSWLAARFASRPPDTKRSYGYHRLEVLAPFVNSMLLFIISFFVLFEAVKRFFTHTHFIDWEVMFTVSSFGLVINLIVFFILHKSGKSDLNTRSALLHIIGDLLGFFATVLASLIIKLTGWMLIDPILSSLILIIILRSAIRIMKASIHILLEGIPIHIDANEISQKLKQSFAYITNVHHIHLWSLNEKQVLATLHIKIDPKILKKVSGKEMLFEIKEFLNQSCGIAHSTIEIEDYHDDCQEKH